MSNSLGFNNFRKFQNFPSINYTDITFLVGKNNSGKSTFVKALVLFEQFLKSDDWSVFNFDNGVSDLINFTTYSRAINNMVSSRIHENFIDFDYITDHYKFYLKITGDENKTVGDVIEFYFIDLRENFIFSYHPQSKQFIIKNDSDYFHNQRISIATNEADLLSSRLQEIHSQIRMLKDHLLSVKDKFSIEFISAMEQKAKLELLYQKTLQEYNIDLGKKAESRFTFYLEFDIASSTPKDIFDEISTIASSAYKVSYNESQVDSNIRKKDREFENLRYFYQNKRYFEFTFSKILDIISNKEYVYIHADIHRHLSLLPTRDKSNHLAQAVYAYSQLSIDGKAKCDRFISHWFRFFEIGDGITVSIIEGDFALVYVNQSERISSQRQSPRLKTKMLLSDLGTGSIQVVKLIMQLCVLLYDDKVNKKDCIVIIEEPEMNLHPKLQSQLCELFYNVSLLGVKLIVETHSEYLIRNTQLFVKEKELQIAPNENPFSVIYFDEDKIAWSMQYREDGKFKNEFGTGFFDESTNLAFELL